MKTIFILFFSSLVFSSCLHLEQIERRHYRSGFYVSHDVVSEKPKSNEWLISEEKKNEFHPKQTTAAENNIDSVLFCTAKSIQKKSEGEKIEPINFVKPEKKARNKIATSHKQIQNQSGEKANNKSTAIILFCLAAIFAVIGFLFIAVGIGILAFFAALALIAVGLRLLFPKKSSANSVTPKTNAEKKEDNKMTDKVIVLAFLILIFFVLLILAAILYVITTLDFGW